MKYGEALQRIVMDDYLAEDYAIRFAIEELYKYIPAPTWLEGGEPLYEMTLVVDPGVLPSDDGYRFEPCPGGARMVASHRGVWFMACFS